MDKEELKSLIAALLQETAEKAPAHLFPIGLAQKRIPCRRFRDSAGYFGT